MSFLFARMRALVVEARHCWPGRMVQPAETEGDQGPVVGTSRLEPFGDLVFPRGTCQSAGRGPSHPFAQIQRAVRSGRAAEVNL